MSGIESTLHIAASHSPENLREEFARKGRLQVRDFLDPASSDAIYACLSRHTRWNLVYDINGRHVAADANAVAKWPRSQRRKLEKIIHLQARGAFQYYYASVPIYEIYHQRLLPGHYFNSIFEFLNGPEFLGFARCVTGDGDISFADAQATRYDAGHFLSCHDDQVGGKHRRAAYVLSMSRLWRPDWGGALQFFDSRGNIEQGYTPAYNALCLFRVPTQHAVGSVAPFAGAPRYSITGWLRSGPDPKI